MPKNKPSSSSSTDPEGLLIGSSSKPWRIGHALGSGACGSVHTLERQGKSSSEKYAVKLAPCPPQITGQKRRKKKTPIEVNADLINYENTLYVGALSSLRGVVIPDVPLPGCGGPPGYGEVNGYRYIVMERMSAPLSSIPKSLLDNKTSETMGDIAQSLLSSMETLHNLGYLVIDVKTENYMLATASSKKMAPRIRMIDIGLIEFYRDLMTRGHREDNYPDAPVVGTPMYASLNVLSGHTPSRRDDLEALGYVMSELILMMGCRSRDDNSSRVLLPWSACRSDEEIHRVKRGAMEEKGRGRSELFQRLNDVGGKKVEDVMRRYFTMVRGLGYTEKPDYEALKACVKRLHVVVASDDVVVSRAKRQPKTTTSRPVPSDDEEGGSPEKRQKTTTSKKTAATRVKRKPAVDAAPAVATLRRSNRNKKRDDDTSTEVVNLLDDADTYHSDTSTEYYEADAGNGSSRSSSTNFYDPADVENSPPLTSTTTSTTSSHPSDKDSSSSTQSLQITVTAGPHKGESFSLTTGHVPSITVGRDPQIVTSRKGDSHNSQKISYKMGKDDDMSAAHARLVLHSSKVCLSVRVTDLNSTNGTFVNGAKVAKGKSRQVFVGDKIQLGTSIFELKKLSL